jgi:AcrR family transcriptional regulator
MSTTGAAPLADGSNVVDGRDGDRAPDDTSVRLIAAAAEVFAEKGYDRAGVQEIARRAGLTTGAIYGRFRGKAELLAAAVETFSDGELSHLFADHAFDGRVTDLFSTVGSHLVTRTPSPSQAILLEAFVAARRDPDVAAVLRGHLDARRARLDALVETSKQSGLVDEDLDTTALVHFAQAVGLGFLLFEALGIEPPAPAPWQGVIDRLVGSIGPAGEPPTAPADVRPGPALDH